MDAARPPRVLVTAFAPYGDWRENASALALDALRGEPPASLALETALYPVDHAALPARLAADLERDFDWALHLGQAPGRARIELEAVALNLRSDSEAGEGAVPLEPGGPAALLCPAPLARWAARLRGAGLPAAVSFHAGTFLCNATLYWSLRLAARRGLGTGSVFVHLPLTPGQVAARGEAQPSLATADVARGLGVLLAELERAGER